ncbi:MAG: flavin reductase [Odoribacter sp.]
MERMKGYQWVKPKEVEDNYIRLIGDQWMLVTAGAEEKFNMMTASWGGVGYLWNKPVVFIFIRPQRYTFGLIEEQEHFTLSFYDEKYRPVLNLCGKISGRDQNKVKESGLTPCLTEQGNIAFEEAGLILECKKLYADFLRPEMFLDPTLCKQIYAEGDFHKMYVAEITSGWKKE